MAGRSKIPIDRTEESPGEFLERHPTYAMIGAYNTSGSRTFFGSELPNHDHYITLRVVLAERRFRLGQDWMYGRGSDLVVEVALTPAQWVTLVSRPNVSSGTPCTLVAMRDGQLVHYDDPPVAKTETEAARDKLEGLADDIDPQFHEAFADIEKLLGNVPAKTRKLVLERFATLHRKVTMKDAGFYASQLREAAERTVASAKMEVESYVQGVLHGLGLKKLSEVKAAARIAADEETK